MEHAPPPVLGPKHKVTRALAEPDVVPRIMYEEKAQELLAKDEMLKVCLLSH